MSRNRFTSVTNHEFVQNIRQMVYSASQDDCYECFITLISSGCDKSSVIAMSILQELTDDASFAKGTSLKDNSIYQYFCLDKVEVFGILKDDQKLSKSDITYVLVGDHGISKAYYERISEKIKTLNDEISS